MATPPFPPGASSPTAPLWASGRFALRVHGVGSNWQRVVEIRRPYALIGRIPGSDVLIDDRNDQRPSHLSAPGHRGLFAVDLASRSGSQIGPEGRAAAWLRPGDSLEVAGRRIELVDLRAIRHPDRRLETRRPPLRRPQSNPAPASRSTRARLPLSPLALNSELVFLGRSAACGIQVNDSSVARIQCVLVRGPRRRTSSTCKAAPPGSTAARCETPRPSRTATSWPSARLGSNARSPPRPNADTPPPRTTDPRARALPLAARDRPPRRQRS